MRSFLKFIPALLAVALMFVIACSKESEVPKSANRISFVEVNMRTPKPCLVTYYVEDVVLLTHELEMTQCSPGAPCNCCAVVSFPFPYVDSIEVEDKPYTKEELLARFKSPYDGFRITQWKEPSLSIKSERGDCKDAPRDEEPRPIEQG